MHRSTADRATATRHSSDEALRRPQTVFQRVFLDHLREQGVSVSGGWELTALHEDERGVDAEVVDVGSGEPRTIRAAYVLGTDGGSSTTRRLAGIAREGEHATEKRLRLIVRTGDICDRVGPAPSATNIVVNAHASGFLAAVSEREWRVYAGPYPLDHEPGEDELLEVGRAAFGFDVDLELMSATTFYHATRIAETFRRGRVLLAGDAAHVRTPGGNLGEGIGDVVNLGWKLAAVLDGHAPQTLLDSYDQERRRHNWRVADHSLARSLRTQATLAEIRGGGIPDDADLGDEAVRRRAEIGDRLRQDRSDAAGVAFDERYDASAAVWYEPDQLDTEPPWRADVYEDDPRPGHRAPDGPVDPHGGTLYDRLGASFGLLVLTEDRTVEKAFAAEAAARSLPFTVVHLTDAAARAVYGSANVLIRPDQHVVWRGTHVPSAGAVLDRVLGHTGTAAPHTRAPVPAATAA
nr:FAD-dependent monooxygenase [Streptomyces sp. S1D4-11]QIY99895.1 monooxygenase [Streptomyces sp. S1D4-11]